MTPETRAILRKLASRHPLPTALSYSPALSRALISGWVELTKSNYKASYALTAKGVQIVAEQNIAQDQDFVKEEPKRTCKTCGETFPQTSEFWHRHGNSYFMASCKTCTNATRKHNEAIRQKLLKAGLYFCACCEQVKSLSEFYTERDRPSSYCKDCKNGTRRKSRQSRKHIITSSPTR